MIEKAIITCITGGVDKLSANHKKQNASFIAFIDIDIKSKLWEIRHTPFVDNDPRRNSRVIKWMPHRYVECRYSLWIDGNIIIKCSIDSLIKKYLKDADISMRKHYVRNCIYDEAQACIKQNLDNPDTIMAQIKRFQDDGFPTKIGLHEGGIILRRHNPKIDAFGEMVWQEISKGSKRDQLAIDYVAWKNKIKIADMPDRNNDTCFIKIAHKKNNRIYQEV